MLTRDRWRRTITYYAICHQISDVPLRIWKLFPRCRSLCISLRSITVKAATQFHNLSRFLPQVLPIINYVRRGCVIIPAVSESHPAVTNFPLRQKLGSELFFSCAAGQKFILQLFCAKKVSRETHFNNITRAVCVCVSSRKAEDQSTPEGNDIKV